MPEPDHRDRSDEPPETRKRRLARNEVAFRQLNESIETAALRFGVEDAAFEFVCECDRPDCFERIKLTRRAYEQIRLNGRRFVVVPGHEDTAIERVVERYPGLVVVEKVGVAAGVAEDADPRDGP